MHRVRSVRYTGSVLGRCITLCASCVLLTQALSGADISGIWTGQMLDRIGDPQDLAFKFMQTGDSLAGKMYGDNESTPISEGRVAGSEIVFAIKTELNGGQTKVLFTGTINGDEIQLTRESVGVKAGAAADKPSSKQTIRLKRLT